MPYRDDLEAQLCSARSEINELKNNLEFSRGLIEKREKKMKFTSLGVFAVISVIFVCLLGSVATFCLVMANKYGMMGAIGGASITLAVLGGGGCGIIAGNWYSIFERRR